MISSNYVLMCKLSCSYISTHAPPYHHSSIDRAQTGLCGTDTRSAVHCKEQGEGQGIRHVQLLVKG